MNNSHLTQLFEEFGDKPFKWGESDCCQFVGRYLQIVTGNDYRKPYGQYDSAQGAADAQLNYQTFEVTMDENFEEVSAQFAQRGDVVMFESIHGMGLGVQTANGIWAMTLKEGLTITSDKAVKAWRIA